VKSPFPVFALGIVSFGLAAGHANAVTASASIGVSATVQASCLASVPTTVFRNGAALSNAAPAASVTCSNVAPYNVSLKTVAAYDATVPIRPTTGSGFALLSYVLGPNLRGFANWRDAICTGVVPGTGIGSALELAIRGRFSMQCAASSADAAAIIVVVTY